MSTKAQRLLNALKASPVTVTKNPRPTVAAASAVVAALPNADQVLERRTISLNATDVGRLEAVERYLESLGQRRLNTSLLVRTALHALEHKPTLVRALEAVQAEDGRRVRFLKGAA